MEHFVVNDCAEILESAMHINTSTNSIQVQFLSIVISITDLFKVLLSTDLFS